MNSHCITTSTDGQSCQAAFYCVPTCACPADELRTAVLAVLRAYISSFNSSSSSSLNFLMQQQQQFAGQSECNWAGSIAGGPAKSTKSGRPPGVAGSVVASFVGSREGARGGASGSGRAQQLQGEQQSDEALTTQDSMRPRGVAKAAAGSGPTVSFAGCTADESAPAVGASISGSKAGLLSSKAERAASYAVSGYAASVAAGSTGRGPAGSVAGSVGGTQDSTGAAGPAIDCLNLHGALMLCKEVRLAVTSVHLVRNSIHCA